MDVATPYLAELPRFLAWFLLAAGLLVAFTLAYALCTPWREFHLVRAGNVAAALSLIGTTLGYALVLASLIQHAVSIPDLLLWGLVGLAVQLLALLAARLLLGAGLRERIGRGEVAAGIVIGGLGIAFGLLNAATMVPDGAVRLTTPADRAPG